MNQRCLILPASVCASALAQVLNTFGPSRFYVAGSLAEKTTRGALIDVVVVTGLPPVDLVNIWRHIRSFRGGLCAVDVREPVTCLLRLVAQREASLRPLVGTALFLTKVFHVVFQHEFLSNGRPGLDQLATDLPRWRVLWQDCEVATPESTMRKLERLSLLVNLAQEDMQAHWETLDELAGSVFLETRAIATAEAGG